MNNNTDNNTYKLVAFQLSNDLYEEIRKFAYDNNMSISASIRFMIEDCLKKEII